MRFPMDKCRHFSLFGENEGDMLVYSSNNNNVYRAFVSVNIPVTKEPVDQFRRDGKRPNGLTSISWQAGKPFTWGVTATYILADSQEPNTSATPSNGSKVKNGQICCPCTISYFSATNCFRNAWPNQHFCMVNSSLTSLADIWAKQDYRRLA
jgi:hypothetical protein